MLQTPALPAKPFETYVPSGERPFDIRKLAHLLRRTAFGLTAARLERFGGRSPSEVLDWLFTYDPNDDPLNHLLDQLDGLITPFTKPEAAQQWWTYRMLKSPRPMQERVALFWHNHFATSVGKGEGNMASRMHLQIDLFRRLGMGNFRELLKEVGRDPAMLVWLDGQFNRKGKPNENYGRELQELFTLGIGNYTETDVKEIARAYTGWRIRNDAGVLDSRAFDDGEKEIYGKKGKFNDEGVVDLILAHPACPKHIAWKMLREFVHPQPTQEMIDYYAGCLTDAKWELKPVLREMLSSNLFFSDWAYRAKIKGPCELVIGAIHAMAAMGGKPSVEYAFKAMEAMGQPIMRPPSVKGWDGEEAWINANTLFLRYNFANKIVQQTSREFARKNDILGFLEKRDLKTPEAIVDHFAIILHDGSLPAGLREKLIAFLQPAAVKGKAVAFSLTSNVVHTKVRSMIHIMMATPEYQLS